MTTQVWVLGGTGRTGRAVAAGLVERGMTPVLVGRDESRLRAAAEPVGGEVRVAADPQGMARLVRSERPTTVLNTVGPFLTTAGLVVQACIDAGSHYADLGNDVGATLGVLDLDGATGASCVVTGAGFGVTATETLVVALCADRPTPERVRVDMMPSLASEEGTIGEALAATILDGLPGVPGGGRYTGRVYRDGTLVEARLLAEPNTLVTPDGDVITCSGMPLGELVAAHHASGAPDVVCGSSEMPSSALARVAVPALARILTVARVRRFAVRRLAAVATSDKPRPREHSFGHATVEWQDGVSRSGWLVVGDAGDYTHQVLAEVGARLARGEGRPGAFTPATLFGASIAESCGARLILDEG